jgi:N utilization substance protein B
MARRRAREYALQVLYEIDQTGMEADAALRALGRSAEQSEREFADRLVRGAVARLPEVDQLIELASTNWRLSRMPLVDRNLLRLAAYELLACPDVPASVSINEAVELAKRFGEKDSRAFVNGILDRIAAETGRGGRRHKPPGA